MITLLRKLFWFALFVIFTLGFVTLWDHGFDSGKQFTTDAKSEFSDLMAMVGHPIKRPPDKSDEPPQ
jgi:hypothetical protein